MILLSSFNIKNKYDNNNSDNFVIKEYLKKYNIDILCIQELTYYNYKLLKEMLSNYEVIGYGRYGDNNILVNETNSIITNEKIIKTDNIKLPWIPSVFPRIATLVYLSTKDDGNICIINTHLDHLINSVKYRELYKIYNIIRGISPSYKIILTGDFNLDINNLEFASFINKLSLLNINRVSIDSKTFKGYKKELAIDHIFISGDLEILEYTIIDDRDIDISDHYPIMVKIRKK